MTRRNSSLGFFGMFGRSSDLRQLDRALREADLHPALVPEGVKLTIVNLMKDHWPDTEPQAEAYPPIARLFAYCVAGPGVFDAHHLADAERRVETALKHPESLDAQLVLLAIHARLINPQVVERFGLSAEDDG